MTSAIHHDLGAAKRRNRSSLYRLRAFTLVEVMVTSGICAVVLGAILGTFFFTMRGFNAVTNYAQFHMESRLALDRFGRDVRAASGISTLTTSSLVVTIPTSFDSKGSVTAVRTVAYSLVNGSLVRSETNSGSTTQSILANHTTRIGFTLFDNQGSSTSAPAAARSIQLSLQFKKLDPNNAQNADYLSARVNMRNKP